MCPVWVASSLGLISATHFPPLCFLIFPLLPLFGTRAGNAAGFPLPYKTPLQMRTRSWEHQACKMAAAANFPYLFSALFYPATFKMVLFIIFTLVVKNVN
jgi:hypothetical protein